MHRLYFAALISLTLLPLLAGWARADAPSTTELTKQAREISQQFVGRLKPQLKRALAEGGPEHAISVCADIAPTIADSLSAESGWSVRRVSLKSRNASRAVPDKWEQSMLVEFDRRQLSGMEAADINVAEVVGEQFRYMQAQGVEPVCLLCHGKGLSDAVQAALEEYYPDDWATGYSLGEVRGAISLSKGL